MLAAAAPPLAAPPLAAPPLAAQPLAAPPPAAPPPAAGAEAEAALSSAIEREAAPDRGGDALKAASVRVASRGEPARKRGAEGG